MKKYIIQLNQDECGSNEALYKKDKLVVFDTKEQASAVASALDAFVCEVVPFGEGWISKDNFEEIDHTEFMDIYSVDKED